jgi:hypothetical protein
MKIESICNTTKNYLDSVYLPRNKWEAITALAVGALSFYATATGAKTLIDWCCSEEKELEDAGEEDAIPIEKELALSEEAIVRFIETTFKKPRIDFEEDLPVFKIAHQILLKRRQQLESISLLSFEAQGIFQRAEAAIKAFESNIALSIFLRLKELKQQSIAAYIEQRKASLHPEDSLKETLQREFDPILTHSWHPSFKDYHAWIQTLYEALEQEAIFQTASTCIESHSPDVKVPSCSSSFGEII